MSEFTRRGFLRTASIGAAAIGALSVIPTLARAQEASATSMTSPGQTAPARGPIPVGGSIPAVSAPVVVYFDDLSSSKGRVFVGEQAIEFDNPMLVQSVQALVG